ncbi:hypothetical protein ACE5D9_06725 [Rickettsia sp. 2024-CO-Wats]|uniref:hypothetical protein n=1 Tax=unclassified Rickettsia TaxID=114295 RepID=UPI00370D2EFA
METDVSYGGVVVVAPVAPLVLPADPREEDVEEVIAVPAVAAPLAPVPVVINMEDVGGVPPPVEEAYWCRNYDCSTYREDCSCRGQY